MDAHGRPTVGQRRGKASQGGSTGRHKKDRERGRGRDRGGFAFCVVWCMIEEEEFGDAGAAAGEQF